MYKQLNDKTVPADWADVLLLTPRSVGTRAGNRLENQSHVLLYDLYNLEIKIRESKQLYKNPVE